MAVLDGVKVVELAEFGFVPAVARCSPTGALAEAGLSVEEIRALHHAGAVA